MSETEQRLRAKIIRALYGVNAVRDEPTEDLLDALILTTRFLAGPRSPDEVRVQFIEGWFTDQHNLAHPLTPKDTQS